MDAPLILHSLTCRPLPSLDEPSVLVIDNAPYHSVLTEDSRGPTKSRKKAGLTNWLTLRGKSSQRRPREQNS